MLGGMFRKTAPFLERDENSALYLGYDGKGNGIWLDGSRLLQHTLVLGTTGAGKTEALLSMMSSAFAVGSGGLFVDGKGDVSSYARIYALAELYDRTSDLHVLNFLVGTAGPGIARRSDRFNPFATGSSDVLTNFLVSLIDTECFKDANSSLTIGRATAMLFPVFRALTFLRDERGERLDAATVYDSIGLTRIAEMAHGRSFGFLPEPIRKQLRTYLQSLPEFDGAAPFSFPTATLEHHGFVQMELCRILGMMKDVYGHIFCAGASDIDFEDLIAQRRFLHVLLPALEKSGDDLAVLGKIVVASLKRALGNHLGRPIEGEWNAVVGERENLRSMPFVSIFDDIAYYMISGMDLLSAMARARGVALVFSSHEMSEMRKVGSATLGDTLSNCAATKIVMKTCGDQGVDSLFEGVVAGRRGVADAIARLGRSAETSKAVFSMPSRIVPHLSEGDMVVISSGRMVVGKFGYTPAFVPKPSSISGPRLRRDFRSVANGFIAISAREAGAGRVPDPAAGLHSAFVVPHEEAMSAVRMLSAALRVLEPERADDTGGEREVVRIGE